MENNNNGKKPKKSVKEMGNYVKSFWKGPVSEGYYLSLKEVGAFGVAGMGMNFIFNLGYIVFSATILPIVYGVDVIHTTIATAVIALLNLIFTPIFGKMVDNTHSKKFGGKIKPYFLFMVPLLSVLAVIATFCPFGNAEKVSNTVKVVYMYLTSVPLLFVQGLLVSLFNLYPSVMTPNSQERSNMLAPVSIIYSFAPTLMNVILGPLRTIFQRVQKEYMAFRIYGIIFAILGFALSLFIFKWTKERVYQTNKNESDEKIGIKEGVKMIVKNKPFLLYLIFGIFATLKVVLSSALPLIGEYKYTDDLVNGSVGNTIYGSLTLVMGFGATPGMLLAPIFIKKFGKKWVLIATLLLQALICLILAIIGFQNMPTGIVTIVITTAYGFFYNFANGLAIIILPSLMADLIDYQQYISDKRIEGFMNTANIWVTSLFGVFLNLLPGIIQSSIGFQYGLAPFRPGSPEFDPANVKIAETWFNIATYISLASVVLSSLPLFFYTFSEKKHRKCIEEIRSRAVGSTFEDEEKIVNPESVMETYSENADFGTGEINRGADALDNEIEKHDDDLKF